MKKTKPLVVMMGIVLFMSLPISSYAAECENYDKITTYLASVDEGKVRELMERLNEDPNSSKTFAEIEEEKRQEHEAQKRKNRLIRFFSKIIFAAIAVLISGGSYRTFKKKKEKESYENNVDYSGSQKKDYNDFYG